MDGDTERWWNLDSKDFRDIFSGYLALGWIFFLVKGVGDFLFGVKMGEGKYADGCEGELCFPEFSGVTIC